MTSWMFWVPGVPATQGSMSYVGTTPKGRPVLRHASTRLESWREEVAVECRQAMRRAGVDRIRAPIPVRLALHFSFLWKGKPDEMPAWHVTMRRQDLDKICRAVFDSMSGVGFDDDSQVAHLTATRGWTVQKREAGLMALVRALG